jgi:hypothetical protein
MATTSPLLTLNSLGGQKAKARREGASAEVLAAIDEQIMLTRAEYRALDALVSVPEIHRQKIIDAVAVQLGLTA